VEHFLADSMIGDGKTMAGEPIIHTADDARHTTCSTEEKQGNARLKVLSY